MLTQGCNAGDGRGSHREAIEALYASHSGSFTVGKCKRTLRHDHTEDRTVTEIAENTVVEAGGLTWVKSEGWWLPAGIETTWLESDRELKQRFPDYHIVAVPCVPYRMEEDV